MSYYNVKINENDENHPRKHSIICISNDAKHDAHTVQVFNKKLYCFLEDNCPHKDTLFERTDECASQYKDKIAFADISCVSKFKTQRCFFETSHWKNVCDGLGATVRNPCHEAPMPRKNEIGSAEELYEYCRKNLYVNKVDVMRKFLFIDTEEINRDRQNSTVDTVSGARKINCVQGLKTPFYIKSKNLSCLCKACKSRRGDCFNLDHIKPWDDKVIKTRNCILLSHKVNSCFSL